ncbi:MAG TPA: hypothetical protein VGF79_16610 [Bacteroidia bacterium]
MKNLMMALLFAFGMSAAVAQNTTFKWGQLGEFKNSDDHFTEVLHFSDNAVFLDRYDYKSYKHYIEKYDANLKLVYSVEAYMTKSEIKNTMSYAGAAVLGGKAYFFIHVWNPDDLENTLMAFELDDKGEEVRRFPLAKISAEKKGKVPDYTFAVSPDQTKLGAIGVYPFEKEDTEKWHAIIYDEAQKKVILDKKNVETKVPQERYEINDLLINNNAVMFSFKRWDIKKLGQFTAFVTLTPNGDAKRTDTELGGKAITSRKVFLNKQGQASVVGFLSDFEKDGGEMAGHYYFTVDEKGDLLKCTHEAFGEDVFKLVDAGGLITKDMYRLRSDYKYVNCVEGDKGEITLFIEKYKADRKSLPLPPGQTGMPPSEYSYVHGEAIAIRLDNTGHRLWAADFKKTQTYKSLRQYVYFGSIVPLMKGDEVYFIWNNIDFPLIPKTGLATPGWLDAAGKKHTLEEYGGRMVHPTCLSGYDANGNPLFADNPVQYAMPLLEMYKGATYPVSFNTSLTAQNGNKVLLIMEMTGGADKGQGKFQLCVVTVN